MTSGDAADAHRPADFSWPRPEEELPAPPERVILHWTAGTHVATLHETQFYHLLLEHHRGDPEDPTDDRIVVRAGVPIARNMRSGLSDLPPYYRDSDRGYAAHTRGLNGFSVGLALCGMRGAEDLRPEAPEGGERGRVAPGTHPITVLQVRAMLGLCVQAARVYDLPPDEEHFFTHWEAEALHGVDQYPPGPEVWKWNVTWLPGFGLSREEAGPFLREQLVRWMEGSDIDDRLHAPPSGETSEAAVRAQLG